MALGVRGVPAVPPEVVVVQARYGQVVRGAGQEAGPAVRMAWMAWTGLCWRMGWEVVWPSCPWQMPLCRPSFSAWACHRQRVLRAATPGRSHSAQALALAVGVPHWSWHRQHWQHRPRCRPPAARTCR